MRKRFFVDEQSMPCIDVELDGKFVTFKFDTIEQCSECGLMTIVEGGGVMCPVCHGVLTLEELVNLDIFKDPARVQQFRNHRVDNYPFYNLQFILHRMFAQPIYAAVCFELGIELYVSAKMYGE